MPLGYDIIALIRESDYFPFFGGDRMDKELKRFVNLCCKNVIVTNEHFHIIFWKLDHSITLPIDISTSISSILPIDLHLCSVIQEVEVDNQFFKITIERFEFDKIYHLVFVENMFDVKKNLQNRLYVLEEIIEKLDEGVLVSNKEGDVIYYNAAQENMEGIQKKDILHKKLWEGYKYERQNSEHAHIFKTGKPIYSKYHAHAKSEEGPKYVGYSSYPIKKDGQTIAVFSLSRTEASLKERLHETIELKRRAVTKDSNEVKHNNGTIYTFHDLKGESSALKKVISEAQNASFYNTDTLIVGETGTGKELFAQSMHNHGPRANKPFVAINCAAIPESLLESTLFGSVKGAFTGAIDQEGLFEYAKEGTLFLDEINSLPMNLQPKLMRVLQERAIRRVGSNELIPISCSVISASNEDPELLTEGNRMRLDLFYRIAHSSIFIPPLRERKEDILFFINHFLINYQNKYLKSNITLAPSLLSLLIEYSWPGNTRELQHLIENLVIQAKNDEKITVDLLPHYLRKKIVTSSTKVMTSTARPLKSLMKTNQAQYIESILQQFNWNISLTAKHLNISRQSLQYHIKKLGITK
ncbi:PAS domain-containing protein [Lysinibacillus sp. BW-2-10]|nr:PAS domain-containing protein [Lysinibacillus sp. BW-2-10]